MNTISKMMANLFEDIEDNSMIQLIEKNEERQKQINNIKALYNDANVAAKFNDPSTNFPDKDTVVKKIQSGSGLQNLKADTINSLETTLADIKRQVDDAKERQRARVDGLRSKLQKKLDDLISNKELYDLLQKKNLTYDTLNGLTTFNDLVKMAQDINGEIEKYNSDVAKRKEASATATKEKASQITPAQNDLIQKIKTAYINNGIEDFVKANLISDFKYKFDPNTPDKVSTAETAQFADATGAKAEADGNKKLNAVLKSIADPKAPNTSLFKAHVAINKKIADIVNSEKDFSKFSEIAGAGDENDFKNAINNNTWDKTPAEKIKILNDMTGHKATNDQVDDELDAKRTNWDLYVVPIAALKFPDPNAETTK